MNDIEWAISEAKKGKSKLTPEVVAKLEGLSSPNVWHLLNNLVSKSKTYLEVGCFKGSTLCAAIHGNNVKAYAVDNFMMNKESREIFYENIKPYKVRFFEQDAWTVELHQLSPIEVFFYDGDHSFEAHHKAITYYYPALAKEFIYVCDDWDMKRIPNATWTALKALGAEVEEVYQLPGNNKEWWNGIGVLRIRK
jgi:hypothetical protein